jgi:hypothetical protein
VGLGADLRLPPPDRLGSSLGRPDQPDPAEQEVRQRRDEEREHGGHAEPMRRKERSEKDYGRRQEREADERDRDMDGGALDRLMAVTQEPGARRGIVGT